MCDSVKAECNTSKKCTTKQSTEDDFWDKIGKKKSYCQKKSMSRSKKVSVVDDLPRHGGDNSSCLDEVDVQQLIQSGDYMVGHIVQLSPDEQQYTNAIAYYTETLDLEVNMEDTTRGGKREILDAVVSKDKKTEDFLDAYVAKLKLQKRELQDESIGHAGEMVPGRFATKPVACNKSRGNRERDDCGRIGPSKPTERTNIICSSENSTETTESAYRVDKFDTACSHTMSGDNTRAAEATVKSEATGVSIKGFNSSSEHASIIFENKDGFRELYVSSMPKDLLLVSAQHYIKHFGGSFLHADGGILFRYKYEGGKEELEDWFNNNVDVVGKITEVNSTYEIEMTEPSDHKMQTDTETMMTAYSATSLDSEIEWRLELAYSATKFFNSIPQVSNEQERVIGMLMSGLSMNDLRSMVKNKSVTGLDKRITEQSLNSVSKDFGTTISHKQLALPYQARKGKGYFAEPEKLTHCGQLVEMDYADALWNFQDEKGNTRKLPTAGGAVCMFTCVDAFSGYAWGALGKNKKDSLAWVTRCSEFYERLNHPMKTVSADQNIHIRSNHQVIVPAVDKFLSEKRIEKRSVENYLHNNGGQHIERFFRSEHELQLYAIIHILQIPQFDKLGFTETQVKSLWGELYHWAKFIINLKECPNVPGKTKWEVFHGYMCDLKRYRLLPILCCCLVLRRTPNKLGINRTFWQRGLYCGPDMEVNGAIRAAVVEKGVVKIVVTSTLKSVSEGLGPDLHQISENYLNSEDSTAITETVPTPNSDERSATTDKSNTVQPTQLDLGGEMQHTDDSNSMRSKAAASNNESATDSGEAYGEVQDYVEDSAEKDSTNSQTSESSKKKQRNINDGHRSRRLRAKQKKKEAKQAEQRKLQLKLEDEQLLELRRVEARRLEEETARTKSVIEALKQKRGPTSDMDFYRQMIASKRTRAERAAQRELNRKVAFSVLFDGENPVNDAEIEAFVAKVETSTGRGSSLDQERVDKMEEKWLDSLIAQQEDQTHVAYHVAYEAHWKNYDKGDYYYSFDVGAYVSIVDVDDVDQGWYEAMKAAVKEDTPKNFQLALKHPEWGQPARDEYNKLVYETTSAVPVPKELAMQNIRKGADLLMFIPIYEIKTDENTGQPKKAVRLVLNGSQQKNYSSTFATTPSREELLVLLHIAANQGMDIVHIDEKRAFLTAEKNKLQELPTYGRFQGIEEWFKINNAIYGMKDAMRDYLDKRDKCMRQIGFERLTMCSSVYKKRVEGEIILVYVHVDDFVFAGKNRLHVLEQINELRKISTTTEPVINPDNVLGLGMNRDADCRERGVIEINMTKKIEELHAKCKQIIEKSDNSKLKEWDKILDKRSNIPMPMDGYIVDQHKLEELGELAVPLTQAEISDYLTVVGSLIWIAGVRFDVCFALMYLTWNSKAPSYHHLKMAFRLVSYLNNTKELPLCLGGKKQIGVTGYSDASLATGPNSRSIAGEVTKLNEDAGAVKAKCKALVNVNVSSFEAELEALFRSMKSIREIQNILDDMEVERVKPSRGFTDNKAMQQFVKSDGVTKGVKHMEMRLWALRLEYLKGDIRFEHMPGTEIPADLLTKLGPITKHWKYVKDILGLGLMGEKWMKQKDLLAKELLEEGM